MAGSCDRRKKAPLISGTEISPQDALLIVTRTHATYTPFGKQPELLRVADMFVIHITKLASLTHPPLPRPTESSPGLFRVPRRTYFFFPAKLLSLDTSHQCPTLRVPGTYVASSSGCCSALWPIAIPGDRSKWDLRYPQEPIYFAISTDNIWSYLLWPPGTVILLLPAMVMSFSDTCSPPFTSQRMVLVYSQYNSITRDIFRPLFRDPPQKHQRERQAHRHIRSIPGYVPPDSVP